MSIIQLFFSDSPDTKQPLTVKREISKGNSSIYQVYSQASKKDYTIKIFPKTEQGKNRYMNEKLVLHFNHPNIIKYVPIVPDNRNIILSEYAKYGSFARTLRGGPLKNELIVRTYFHQLIEGLEYIHSQGFVHLDLTLDNLLIGSDYMLKIADFDKSDLIINTNNCISIESCTSCYSEGIFGTTNKVTATDIFSAGVALFAFRTGKLPFMPFENDNDDDCKNPRSYSYYLVNTRKFWKSKSKSFFGQIRITKDFMELVDGMLCPNPEERFTIQQIKNSKWYKGPILDMKKLKAAMKPRCRNLRKGHSKLACIVGLCLYAAACFCSFSSTGELKVEVDGKQLIDISI